MKTANRLRAAELAFALPALDEQPRGGTAKAVAEGVVLGAYRFDRYRTTNKDEKAAPKLERGASSCSPRA